MRWLTCLLASASLAACSLLTVHKPPAAAAQHARDAPHDTPCTSSAAAPIADAVIAAGLAATTGVALVSEADSDPMGDEGPPGPPAWLTASTLVVGAGSTLLFTGSAVYGANAIVECRDASAQPDSSIDQALRAAREP